jgi:hypothetical protein
MKWRDLSTLEKAIAYHEAAGHALLGELLNWRVRFLRSNGEEGLCQFIGKAPTPLVDLVVSAGGHAAEAWYCGGVVGGGSYSDREEAASAVERAGLEEWESPFAVADVEARLWPVFASDAVSAAARRVARALGRRGYLSRREFLSLAAPALNRSTRRRVRRYCSRMAMEVFSKHLEEAV